MLTDFGLSKEFEEEDPLRRTNSYCGTIEYMAPGAESPHESWPMRGWTVSGYCRGGPPAGGGLQRVRGLVEPGRPHLRAQHRLLPLHRRGGQELESRDRRVPFSSLPSLLCSHVGQCRRILAKKVPFPRNMPPSIRDFVDKMVQKSPGLRLGARGVEDIKRHPFFLVPAPSLILLPLQMVG